MTEEEQEKKPELVSKLSKLIPTVGKPDYKQTLNKRLMWSGIALLCYFLMSYITVYGLASSAYQQFQYMQMVLGAKFGSLTTLGIGPIVTSGIILQLLVGSKIINWELTKPEGRKKFQSWSKILGVAFCFIEAIAFVIAGALPVNGGLIIGIFVMLQIAAGGIIIILLDDLVSKWGFGSGLSLFIVAGVASQIFISLFSWMSIQTAAGTSKFVGAVPGLISSLITGNYYLALLYLTPILTTAIIFFVVLYVSAIHVDIPLAFSSLRGFGRTWSLKFLYASVIPVIFISALLANVQVMGQIGAHPTDDGGTCGPLGCFNSQKSPTSGVVYYLTSPHSLVSRLESSVGMPSTEILRAFTYVIFLCVGAMIFSIFWVSTSGMDAKSVANQLEGSGMQIPGYRRDPRIMESVLNRYIPALTVLGGIAIGLLAAGADFLGAIGSGTGILLTTMIITDLYERLRHENIEEAHPVIRKLIGE